MAVGLKYRNLTNIRPVGSETVVYDYITIPGAPGPGSYIHRIAELPLNVPLPNPHNSAVECREVDAFDVELAGPVRLTPIDQFGVLTAGKFVIKYGTQDADDTFRYGQIKFSQFDAGRRFKIICTGRGSLVYAEDILNLNTAESLLPNVIKPEHISITPTDDFSFPGDVTIDGNLTIAGEVNRDLSEIFEVTDDFIRINSDFTVGAPTIDAGLQVSRGSSPDAAVTWDETLDQWVITGGPLSVPGGIAVNRHDVLATAAQTVVTLPWQYNAGTNQLMVFRNGLLQAMGATKDYEETSISGGLSSEVTFTFGLELDNALSFISVGA